MQIWKQPATLEGLNALNDHTMGGTLGIVFTEIGEDYLTATMPANEKTVQPFRILHGGANVALAETWEAWPAPFVSTIYRPTPLSGWR